ncbi:MAG: nucleoside triphosphate pyrophosphohydrolase [Candidatus Polarisedimenticolaceae bacterium]|nr:nucleoside triphosphate pyrophosphohydrolase [Candidatus Polarisedimenticolaceae bacterium]
MATKPLQEIMRALRADKTGCPWDRQQSFASIAPYTIEEAYEVADAIAQGDMDELRGELGDLLFQVVFHAQMAEEAGHFGFDDVVETICEKMIRRHPHVFAGSDVADAEAQSQAWELHKAAERRQKQVDGETSQLAGVALGLPALLRAEKLQKRASQVGFDWPELSGVIAKIDEELAELKEAIAEDEGKQRLSEELGDLLFSCANLARRLDIDAETAVRDTNRKFERRFAYIEQQLSLTGIALEEASLEEMERLWNEAKSQ